MKRTVLRLTLLAMGFLFALPAAGQDSVSELKPRVDAFAQAWLQQRDPAATLAFVDDSAYQQNPVIGAVCDGWYGTSMPKEKIRQIVSDNLIGTANDFPKDLVFHEVLRPQLLDDTSWKSYATNAVDKDGYLLVSMTETTENAIFFPRFKPVGERYAPIFASLRKKNGALYWASMPMMLPDGDMFVVFTIWQHVRDNWYITHIDVACQ